MSGGVGITTNPGKRREYWLSRYPDTLTNWRILGTYPSKSIAQTAESVTADQWGYEGYESHPGGDGPEIATWYLYAFEHNGR